jgi:hypothetical protein
MQRSMPDVYSRSEKRFKAIKWRRRRINRIKVTRDDKVTADKTPQSNSSVQVSK